MNFTDHIIEYYNTESRHGFTAGLISGLVLVIAGILFRWLSSSPSIAQGLSIMLLIGGTIFSVGGYNAGSTTQRALPEKIQFYQTNKWAFLEKEVVKVESIHKAWTGIRIFWTAFIVLGLILIFSMTKPFWIGIAIGALLVGTIGHIEEVVSFQHNEKYRHEVRKEYNGLNTTFL